MAHDVFISYSHTDKPTADAACATLESRGIRCWIAPRDVLPGEEYASALVTAIHSSRMLVLVFSSGANQSPQVLREVERAVSKGLPILPLRIEDIAPSAAMEYYISSRHWLDALTTPLEQHLVQLADTVTLLLARAPGGAAPAPPREAVKPVPPPSSEPVEEAPPKERPAPRPTPVADPSLALRRRVVLAGLVILATVGASADLWSRSQAYFGWSTMQVAGIAALRLLLLAVGLVGGGIALRNAQPRRIVTLAALLYGLGLLLAGLVVRQFGAGILFVLLAGIAGVGTGLGAIAAISTLLKWFPDRRGMIAGVATAAWSAGAFPLAYLLSRFGPIAMAPLGLASLVILGVAARFLQNPAPGYTPAGWVPSPQQLRERSAGHQQLREARGTRQWWTLWTLLLANTVAGVISVVSVVTEMEAHGGGARSAFFAPIAASQVLGCLIFARLSDRTGRRKMWLFLLTAQALLFVLLSGARVSNAGILVTIGITLLSGGVFAITPALTADYFGSDDVGAVYGLLLSAWCLGLALAPLLFLGMLVGLTEFPWRCIMLAVTLLVAAFIAWRLRPPGNVRT